MGRSCVVMIIICCLCILFEAINCATRNFTDTLADQETGESILYRFTQPTSTPRIIGHHIRIRKYLPLSTIELFVPRSVFYTSHSPRRRPKTRQNRITKNILLGNSLFSGNSLLPGNVLPGNNLLPGNNVLPGNNLLPGNNVLPGNNLLPGNNVLPGNNLLLGTNGINQGLTIASNRPLRFCPNCVCGNPFFRDSIDSPDVPWLAALFNNNEYFCSGSLINDRYVLSAAHCMLRRFRVQDILVGFLAFNQANQNQFGFNNQLPTLSRAVSRILIHRFFRVGGTYNNDIALVNLATPIIFDATFGPVCLPPDFRTFDGFDGVASRWNSLNLNGTLSPSMQQTNVRILPNFECRRSGYGQGITNNMVCARNLDSDFSTCQGDSGGPLQVTNGTFYVLVGIVSWGESCPELTFPEVYTRVNNYLPWIYQNTLDACYC